MSAPRTRRLVALVVGALFLAGCGGGGSDSGPQAYTQPSGKAKETLKIEAGNFYFKPDNPTVSSGIVNLELDDAGGGHTLLFDNGKVPGFQLEVSGVGSKDVQKIDLKPGKYTFYCDILGHRAQGMVGTLTVK